MIFPLVRQPSATDGQAVRFVAAIFDQGYRAVICDSSIDEGYPLGFAPSGLFRFKILVHPTTLTPPPTPPPPLTVISTTIEGCDKRRKEGSEIGRKAQTRDRVFGLRSHLS